MKNRIRHHARKAAEYAATGDPKLKPWARWHEAEMRRLKAAQGETVDAMLAGEFLQVS